LEVRWSRREKSIQSECSEKKNLANSQVKVPTSLPPVQYKKDTNKKSKENQEKSNKTQQNAGRYMQSTAQFAQFIEVTIKRR